MPDTLIVDTDATDIMASPYLQTVGAARAMVKVAQGRKLGALLRPVTTRAGAEKERRQGEEKRRRRQRSGWNGGRGCALR